MATFRLLALVFLVSSFLAMGTAQAADVILSKDCMHRTDLVSAPVHSCEYWGIRFTVDTGTPGEQSNCTLSFGNSTEFLVPTGAQQFFYVPASVPVGQNRIRCNVTKTSFIEKPFTVYGAILDAAVDTPSTVYMNSTVSLNVKSADYDWPDEAAPGFSACWNMRDPSSGQVLAQWLCSNATTAYQVPASLPIGQGQFVLLLQSQNRESLFKYIPVAIRSSPTFSSSMYPDTQVLPTSGGKLHYTVSVAALSSVDITASWVDGRVTLDGKPSSVSLHADAGKTGKFGLTFDVPAATTGCEVDCPQQKFSMTLTDQYGNSQQISGKAMVTDRYTSSFSLSPETLGRLVVQPGSESKAEVVLTNTGKLEDAYSAVLIGDAASYSTISPETMNLAAGGSGKYVVTISGSSSLQSGPLRACFSSKNQPSVQLCANATVSLGSQDLPVALFVQPRSMVLSVGENGTIEAAAVSSLKDAVFSGILESNCAEWLSNTEWLSLSRQLSGRYTNNIYVKPTEVGTCTVRITLRAQGASPRSATVEIVSSLPETEIDVLTRLSEDIVSNLTLLQSKAGMLKNAGVSAGFISDLEQKATYLAETCRDDVSGERYSSARTSCGGAQAGLKNALDVLDYGGQSVRVSRPFYISPVVMASAILIALSAVYLIVMAPTQSL